MKRREPPLKPPHIKFVVSKGKRYAYFNTGRKVNGKTVYHRLPDPSHPSFWASYNTCKAARDKSPAKAPYSVAKLFDDYESSREFRALSAGTQRAYRVYLRAAAQEFGAALVDELTRADIRMVLNGADWGAGKQNLFVATIGAAYKWGRENSKTESAPTRDIPQAETGEHLPWPDDAIDMALACTDDQVRFAVALMLYTGQRIGDVCALRWSNIRDGFVSLKQQKTGKELDIRIYSKLQAELDTCGKRGLTLLTNTVGGPVRPGNLRDRIKAFCASIGHPTLRPHGLRKNAVMRLLEAGCTVAETASITGQTFQLVEHYAKRINQRRMSGAAILRLEQHGNEKTRENAARKAADSRGSN